MNRTAFLNSGIVVSLNAEAGPVKFDTYRGIVDITVLPIHMSWTLQKFRSVLKYCWIGSEILHRREDILAEAFASPKQSPIGLKTAPTAPAEYEYKGLRTILDEPMEASMTDSCGHDWEIVYVSVRFSNRYGLSLYEKYVKTLRKDYTKAYQPRTSQ